MYIARIQKLIRAVRKCGINHKNVQYTEGILYKNIAHNAHYLFIINNR